MRIFIALILATSLLAPAATDLSLGQNEKSDKPPKELKNKNSQPAVQKDSQSDHPRTPSPVGGSATVIGADEPEKCLRIRSGPGKAYEPIGCAKVGDQLQITGVWTSNNWAQLANKGWVYGPQIKTDVRPPKQAYSQSAKYLSVKGLYPEYDSGYLPDYGYATYRRSEGPMILYDVNVWQKYHPWWWRKGQVWDATKKDWVQSPSGTETGMKAGAPAASVTTQPKIPPAVGSSPNKLIHKRKGKPRRFVGSAAAGFGTIGSRVRFGASGEESIRRDDKQMK